MEAAEKKRSFKKKAVPAMTPVMQWLTQPMACSYMDLSVNELKEYVKKGRLTVSASGRKIRYKVAELNQVIEEDIIIRKIN